MLHDKHRLWLAVRGLDPELAEKLGLETTQRDGKNWLAVPYRENGEVINHKYRLTSEKDHRMDPGAPLALWNADCLKDPRVRDGQAPVVITEGEWDAIAAMQAGIPFAVSVPNGAPGKPTEDLDTAKRYEWVDRHADDLREVKRFVIAADSDQAGHYLRTELIALLGADRCSFIEYPFPCKDLNEVLVEYGPEKVVECITLAREVPVKGLYRLDQFPERGEIRKFSIGVEPISDMIWIVPGTLTVLTGWANQGKSTLLYAIMAHAIEHHFPICAASFETDVKPIFHDGMRAAILKCGRQDLHRFDTAKADKLLAERMSIISQTVDEDQEMGLDDFLGLARRAVDRHGAKMIVLDPWNELEHKRRRDESETEYIGRAIRAIRLFAKRNDVAFWIVAHPSKPHEGVRKIPGLYDIAGSAHWANKPDYGITYHRTNFENNLAKIIVNKVRDGYPGKRGEVEVVYNPRRSEFKRFGEIEPEAEDEPALC